MIKVSHIIVSILIHAAVIAAALALISRRLELGIRNGEGGGESRKLELGIRNGGGGGEEKVGGGGESREVEYFDLIEVPAVVTVPKPTPSTSTSSSTSTSTSTLTSTLISTLNSLTLDIRYPRRARRERREGEVKVQATVEPGGRVSEARIVKSSGHEDLDLAALKGVEGTRLEKEVLGRDGAVDERRTIIIPVVFRIND